MRRICVEVAIALIWICAPVYGEEKAQIVTVAKPTPEEALDALKLGNQRFFAMKAAHPHSDLSRLRQAGLESQSQHAYATVLTCSDSRIPVERVFDAGVMDLFVIRIAGNVCNSDQAGSIEYGLAHVKTPVLVVMGHSQCGAVTAVAEALKGKGHALERNIPGMIASIQPAVKRVMQGEEGSNGPNLIDKAIEENVWQAIENLFLCSPRTRELVTADKVKVVGAVYDVATGRVKWLPDSKVYRLLGRAEADPRRATEAMADDGHSHHGDDHKPTAKPAVADTHSHAKSGEHAPADAHAKSDSKDSHAHAEAGAHGKANPKAAKVDANAAHDDGHGDHVSKNAEKKKDSHGEDAHAAKNEEAKDKVAAVAHGAEGDSHGGEKAAATEAAAPKSKPWALIGIAGGIAVLGAVLLLLGMKKPKEATAGGTEAHAPAH